MTTPNPAPVARLIVATTTALEAYQAGRLVDALEALDGIEADPIPERPEWVAGMLESRAEAARHGPVPAAARDWIALARDRLGHEMGGPNPGALPSVPCSLRSALRVLGA